MKYCWVCLLSQSSFFSSMRWEVDKTSRYFIITSDSRELTTTMSEHASASGVKQLQEEHSLLFLKKHFQPLNSCPDIYVVMPASTALSSCLWQFDDGQLWCYDTTAQPPASAGTIILDTDPNNTGNCGCALPDTLRSAWGLLLGWRRWGLPQGEDLQENARIFTETTLSKQHKEKGISRVRNHRSSGWRFPRGGRLKTCDLYQEKEGFSSDYRGIIAEEV